MVEVVVCIGSACHVKGSYNIITAFQQLVEQNDLNDKVTVKATFCSGHCEQAVSVKVNEDYYSVAPENTREFFKNNIIPLCK